MKNPDPWRQWAHQTTYCIQAAVDLPLYFGFIFHAKCTSSRFFFCHFLVNGIAMEKRRKAHQLNANKSFCFFWTSKGKSIHAKNVQDPSHGRASLSKFAIFNLPIERHRARILARSSLNRNMSMNYECRMAGCYILKLSKRSEEKKGEREIERKKGE